MTRTAITRLDHLDRRQMNPRLFNAVLNWLDQQANMIFPLRLDRPNIGCNGILPLAELLATICYPFYEWWYMYEHYNTCSMFISPHMNQCFTKSIDCWSNAQYCYGSNRTELNCHQYLFTEIESSFRLHGLVRSFSNIIHRVFLHPSFFNKF